MLQAKAKKKSTFNKLAFPILTITTIGTIGIAVFTYLQTSEKAANTEDLKAQTVMVESKDWVSQIPANGVVQAERRVNLSPEDSGKVTKLLVNEGNRVQKGQIIAWMNSDRIAAQVNQYKALLVKAEADLAQKVSGNRPEEVAQAKARLMRSQAELQQSINSSPQEIATAQMQVKSAKARLKLAESRLKSNQMLVKEGAISPERFNEVETEYQTNRVSWEEALQRLEQLRITKQQQIAQQRAALEEAKQAFRQSQNGTRPQEIIQAEAEVRQAKAQLAFHQSQLNNTAIRAPFAGIITRRFAQEGDFVSPSTAASNSEGASSTSIAELSSGLEIDAKIPEANISRIEIAQKVEMRTDTFPDDVFIGKVKLIAPRAVQENNITSFRVKIGLVNGQEKLKSGMNVRLVFKNQPIKNALVIPLAAVVTQSNGQTGVYLADNKFNANFHPIKVSSASGDKVRVLDGLKLGDRIFLSPPEGQKIEGVDTVNISS